MAETTRVVIADQERLREILTERGLPAKLGATLNFTERKVHELLCAAYDFAAGTIALEMPRNTLQKCGPEFAKIWASRPTGRIVGGKVEVAFMLTPKAIKTTLRTTIAKDSGILKAKVNQVRLHTSWSRYLTAKAKPKTAAPPADWSREEAAARAHNAAITEQILDGKTFNAHKDNPWARKHLKNRNR